MRRFTRTPSSNQQESNIGRMQISSMRLEDLNPNDNNPRRIDETHLQGLQESVRRFGLVQPIIFNQRTRRVVGGHQRLRILEREGVEKTDVVIVDMPEEEEIALNISLNNPHTQGEFTESSFEFIESMRDSDPDLYDSLNIRNLHDDLLGSDEVNGSSSSSEGVGSEEPDSDDDIEAMQILPFEHYDYLLLLARDQRDFMSICELLGVKRVNCSPIPMRKKIGLGRCIPVSDVLRFIGDLQHRIRELEVEKAKLEKSK